MKKNLTIRVTPRESADEELLKKIIAASESRKPGSVSGFNILKKSIDARGRDVLVNLSVEAFINEPFIKRKPRRFQFPDVTNAENRVLIIGAGPAGLFAALRLMENGIRPVILERGRDVRSRRRDLALLNKEGIINPESNYCFGEGGAGTYSDGKLYTRSTKRGDVERILNLLVQFGADDSILYESHPHIGTNKLPHIITAIRQAILDHGGEIHFQKKMTGIHLENGRMREIRTADGNSFTAEACILATGHSARDVFELLHANGILVEFKPFALGVRVEHPQQLIDSVQYHNMVRDKFLPPASYSLVTQVSGKGVFSFCMCPGGIIAPASTAHGELVVNGWSPSKRNNPFANSGIVVTVEDKDIQAFAGHGPLAGVEFQRKVEQQAFHAGGGKFVAPAQRLVDFTNDKESGSLPECSYLPGIRSASLQEVLPGFIHTRLVRAFREFGKRMKGYYTNEAVVVATESRTSSPVRIPRGRESLAHPQVKNLYPCGEGAGYAGGIVSAAMDGERVAEAISLKILNGTVINPARG